MTRRAQIAEALKVLQPSAAECGECRRQVEHALDVMAATMRAVEAIKAEREANRQGGQSYYMARGFPVLDAAGKPTGQFEQKWGKDGELGYLEWLARNHPGHFASLYGRLIPLDVNTKVEEKPVVRYETVEERGARQ